MSSYLQMRVAIRRSVALHLVQSEKTSKNKPHSAVLLLLKALKITDRSKAQPMIIEKVNLLHQVIVRNKIKSKKLRMSIIVL